MSNVGATPYSRLYYNCLVTNKQAYLDTKQNIMFF